MVPGVDYQGLLVRVPLHPTLFAPLAPASVLEIPVGIVWRAPSLRIDGMASPEARETSYSRFVGVLDKPVHVPLRQKISGIGRAISSCSKRYGLSWLQRSDGFQFDSIQIHPEKRRVGESGAIYSRANIHNIAGSISNIYACKFDRELSGVSFPRIEPNGSNSYFWPVRSVELIASEFERISSNVPLPKAGPGEDDGECREQSGERSKSLGVISDPFVGRNRRSYAIGVVAELSVWWLHERRPSEEGGESGDRNGAPSEWLFQHPRSALPKISDLRRLLYQKWNSATYNASSLRLTL